jgi:hypothetical protein
MNETDKEVLQASRREFLMRLIKSGATVSAAIVAGTSFPLTANAEVYDHATADNFGYGSDLQDNWFCGDCVCSCTCVITCSCHCRCDPDSGKATARDTTMGKGKNLASPPTATGISNAKSDGVTKAGLNYDGSKKTGFGSATYRSPYPYAYSNY